MTLLLETHQVNSKNRAVNAHFSTMQHTSEELYALYEQTFSIKDFDFEPSGLYEPVKHIMAIPGKRIRPTLLMMACEMFGGDVKNAIDAAFAMEIFHNFTLVHDDIMDKADIRRGKPTVHKVFGINAGILAGDVMLSYAYKYLCRMPKASLADALDVFNQTSIEIYEGQQLDVDFETRMDVTVDEYLKMIKFKTSVLLAGSLQIGAIIANASKEDQAKIYQFGLDLGLSFQIKDDFLDTFGEGEKVGKRIGGDILNNKKTYLLINTLMAAQGDDKALLLTLLDEKEEQQKIDGVITLMNKYGIAELTSQKIEDLYQSSLYHLEGISIDADKKAILKLMAEKVHQRDY